MNPEKLEQMKILRLNGNSYAKIGEAVGVSAQVVIYHLNEKYRKESIQRAKFRNKYSNSLKWKEYHKNYMKEYQKRRYHDDPIFREKAKMRALNIFNYKKENRLCTRCGSPLQPEDVSICLNCKIKYRKN